MLGLHTTTATATPVQHDSQIAQFSPYSATAETLEVEDTTIVFEHYSSTYDSATTKASATM
eukprot:6283180-Pyramimonas_sp.AAC.1